jgi:flavin reductase (DIM6/NTAB) family NADH-FMN oxidoreductase RutF
MSPEKERTMKKKLGQSTWSSVLYANPVVLVSTRSPSGVDNVSPYGMCMPISSKPPLMAIGVHPARDTYGYIKERKEFAINLLTPELKEACETTARGIPPEESEFDLAGLTRVQAQQIDVALVAESPANMECRLYWMKEAGDHDVVVGEVVAVWINEELFDEDTTTMRLKYDGLYHVGARYFRRGSLVG